MLASHKKADPNDVVDGFDSEDTIEQEAEFEKLSEILAIKETYIKEERLFKLDPDLIHPDPDQPRKHFDEEEVKARASSMDELGQHTAIKVYFSEKNQKIQIWFGETRWRAKKDYCKDRLVLCQLVPEPDDDTKFDNQVDENLQRAAFTVAELLDITEKYIERYTEQGHEDVTNRVAERLKCAKSEVSRRATIITAMKKDDELIGTSFRAVIEDRKLENMSALYFLASALMADCTERKKGPARDLVLQALNDGDNITKEAANQAYKQATGKAKLSYKWEPKYLEVPGKKDAKNSGEAEDTDSSNGPVAEETSEKLNGEQQSLSSENAAQQTAPTKPKPPGRVLKSLQVDVLENSEYLKLTANTGYITKEQALQLSENLRIAAESM
ncbi:ParB/RepB/Spo0J family partition protein [Marinobacter sp.]|uniref:ParB/RepB/Spo0J family partition protein n=1 Tax=Marinobacter sp. TaxID=50741 RepID=UPI0035649BB8